MPVATMANTAPHSSTRSGSADPPFSRRAAIVATLSLRSWGLLVLRSLADFHCCLGPTQHSSWR